MSSPFAANTLFRVDGMVAVITGGGSGIGLTMAKSLMANGAEKIYILGRRLDVLEAAANENPGLIPIQCDVTVKDSLQTAVDKVTTDAGFINLLVVNSGITGPPKRWDLTLPMRELRQSMFTDLSMEEFSDALSVNSVGAFFTMTAFLELLDAGNKSALKGGFGAPAMGITADVPAIQSQVIFTGSLAAFSRMSMSTPAYGSSKAAVLYLAKQASSMLARYGIRANALAPGLFPSQLAAGLIGDRQPELEPYGHPKFIPARRFGGEPEMGGSVLFLASRAGSYCNGVALLMDGGRTAVMPSSY